MAEVELEGSLRLGERLGQGAVATVCRVHGPDDRVYAGKVLHASHEQDEASAARFAQEAELLEGLGHDNLVRIHGRSRIDDKIVLLMELVEGPTLAERIAREAPMPATVVQQLGRGIADGLAYAHAAGIVHRDLKPANVLLAEGTLPKIADFGMARATSLAGVDRSALTVLGTPDYMAPECVDPLAVDARADLYALGCILFEMLTGRPPYSAATPLGVLKAHRDEPIPALPREVPEPLRDLIEALLAKAPGDRPQAAEAVRDDLDAMSSATNALALRGARPMAGREHCVSCGAPLVAALGVCAVCGLALAHLEAGDYTVLVVGPGDPGDKLDAELRERLRQWLTANPSLGLLATDKLDKKIPRVPFPVTGRVSMRSGKSIATALQGLGLIIQIIEGGAMKSPEMRAKASALAGRAALIAMSASAGLWHIGWAWVAMVMAMLVGTGVVVVNATQRVTRDTGERAKAVPPAVRAALDRARKALPAVELRRHRQSLRAVLGRVVDLAPEAGDDAEAAEDLARASDAALAATSRLDALDRQLTALDRDDASKDARALLHARDTWAARLLSLTATLDTYAMRRAAAGARHGLADDAERLDSLRAQVEALEEVQSQ